MVILTSKNVKKYVNSRQSDLPFTYKGISQIEEITEETYVNWIFRVVFKTATGPLVVYLRQSRNFVKKKPEYKLPAERIAYEEKILGTLQQLVPGVVPEVIYFDATNNVLWLADIKQGCPLLVKELVAGRVHPEAAAYFGKIVATIHGKTFGIKHSVVRGSASLNKAAVDFHLGMRLAPAIKMFPSEAKKFLAESQKASTCLVLGDLASKNIFVDGDKVRFLDLERSFIGDPAFDSAFLFCHFLLEVPPRSLSQSIKFVKQFVVSYLRTIGKYIPKSKANQLEKRISKFLGITILYRLFGFYLVVGISPDKDRWTELAKRLLAGTLSINKLSSKLLE
ncbi:MAG: aminoglycoside phosphotransferase family protein [Candidatus Magasanikbacteria bacterium]|nr:aminoglycoside phosphotransferase family protein [Candidatus Magasanikbacteria bacterium]